MMNILPEQSFTGEVCLSCGALLRLSDQWSSSPHTCATCREAGDRALWIEDARAEIQAVNQAISNQEAAP